MEDRPLSAALVQQRLEFGDGLKILGTPGRPLELDQLFQCHDSTGTKSAKLGLMFPAAGK
jgi:hypothetical protein